MIQNLALQDQRCQLANHEKNEFIKVCINQSCDNRRLCFICCEDGNHQKHEKFEDQQIMRMTLFIKQLELTIYAKQQQITVLNDQLDSINQIFDSIKDEFSMIVKQLNQQLEFQKGRVEQIRQIFQRLQNKQYKQSDINNSVNIISNPSYLEADFHKYVTTVKSIQSFIEHQLQAINQQEIGHHIIEDQPNLQNEDNQDQYTQSKTFSLNNNIIQTIDCDKAVKCAQISPCNRFLAYSMQKKLIVTKIQLNQFGEHASYDNDNYIQSIQFSSDSCMLYFSDSIGFIIGFQMNNHQERFKVHTQPDKIEQFFLVNDVKFISLCLKKQQIRISKLESPDYFDDSQFIDEDVQSNSCDDVNLQNEFYSRSESYSNPSDSENSYDDRRNISCEYYLSDLIEIDHEGYLQIDFNQQDNLLVYPYDKYIWIQSFETQQSFKRWIDEYDKCQSLVFKFQKDGKQLAAVQSNRLLLYQVITNQITLLLIIHISLNSDIFSLSFYGQTLICDHGDYLSAVKNNQVSKCGDFNSLFNQQHHYETQSDNRILIILRRRKILLVDLELQQ